MTSEQEKTQVTRRDVELACWRIWYRLDQRGDCSAHNLMANCGIHEDLLKEAGEALTDMGMVQKTIHPESGETIYTLREPKPRMMQVFPTLGGGHMSDENEDTQTYSVGPLSDSTWLTLYDMLSHAQMDAPEFIQDEYREAKEEFLNAHPDDAIGNPEEEWSEGMKEAWNDMVMEMIEDV